MTAPFYVSLLSAAAAALFISIATVRRKGWGVLFTYHPIFMGVCMVAILFGTLQYFAPPSVVGGRGVARTRHYAVQSYVMMSTLVLGTAAIVGNKLYFNKRLWPHSWHSWVGVLTVALTVLQVVVGLYKRSGGMPPVIQRLARYHTQLGIAVLALFATSTVLGLFSLFDKPAPEENEVDVAYFGTALVGIAFTAAYFAMADTNRITSEVAYAPVPRAVEMTAT